MQEGSAGSGLRNATCVTITMLSRSHVRFEIEGTRHRDAPAERRDPLAGYPGRVDDPAAGDEEARPAARPGVAKLQAEFAGRFVLGILDLQAADGTPSGRHPDQQLRPEADLRVGPAVQETWPRQPPGQDR